MIFAAGLGKRMGELTKIKPKPLMDIGGKPLLRRILESAVTYNFKKIVINTHIFSDQIEETVRIFEKENVGPYMPKIITVHEEILLETGGGIKNAINILGEEPIFVMNGDSLTKSGYNIFEYLENKWESGKMDFLLSLIDKSRAVGYKGKGDFELSSNGTINRPLGLSEYRYVYSGLCILNPKAIYDCPKEIFSLKELFFSSQKIYGLVPPGLIYGHLTGPEDLLSVESLYK